MKYQTYYLVYIYKINARTSIVSTDFTQFNEMMIEKINDKLILH